MRLLDVNLRKILFWAAVGVAAYPLLAGVTKSAQEIDFDDAVARPSLVKDAWLRHTGGIYHRYGEIGWNALASAGAFSPDFGANCRP